MLNIPYFKETLYNANTNIDKIKEIIIRFTVYEEIEEFQVLINQLKTIIGQFENRYKIINQVLISRTFK